MKIDTDQFHNIRIKEVFSCVLLETGEGNQIGVCMRDDTLEINVCPDGKNSDNWWRVNMQDGTIEKMRAQPLEVLRTYMKGNFTLDLDNTACSAGMPNDLSEGSNEG